VPREPDTIHSRFAPHRNLARGWVVDLVRAAPDVDSVTGGGTIINTDARAVAAPPTVVTRPARTGPAHARSWSTFAVAVVSVASGGVLLGRPGCGFDSSWALTWAGDALHGRQATRPIGVALPTPHPASLIWGALMRLGPASASRTVWAISTEFVLVVLLIGVFALGYRLGGRLAGSASVLTAAALPALGAAVGGGTVDVLFAAAVVSSVALAASRPSWAVTCAAVATLARPEGLALLTVLTVYRWRNTNRRLRIGAIAAALLTPSAWLLMGATLFGDPLAALHITVANARAGHDHVGFASVGRALHAGGGTVGVTFVICAILAGVAHARRDAEVAFAAAACASMGIALVVISVNGAAIPARYFAGELALATPIAIGAICSLRRRWSVPVLASSGATAAVAVFSAACVFSSLGPRANRAAAETAQGRELSALVSILHREKTCATISLAPHVFIPVVILQAHRPVLVTAFAGGGASGACRLAARDALTAAGDGWGPEPAILRLETVSANAKIVAADPGWIIYVP